MKRAAAIAIVLACFAGAAVFADGVFGQRRGEGRDRSFGGERRSRSVETNVEYDGRLTFVRVSYTVGFVGFRAGGTYGEPPWMHDYPTADIHMMKILKELTLADPNTSASNVLALDDPALFDYPILYMSEPGFWNMTDEEAKGLRNYLLKGGFIMFDDFRDEHWYTLEQQMQRALPELRWVQIDTTNKIFHSFFEIDALDLLTSYGPHKPEYWALFEDNDPSKRVMAMANFNNDLGEYWEFSDQGIDPVDLSNEAYKFGVNYFIYALIH